MKVKRCTKKSENPVSLQILSRYVDRCACIRMQAASDY